MVLSTSRRAARTIEVLLAAGHEERARLSEAVQALEIDVAAIHHVKGAGLDRQVVQGRDIVHFSVRNMHKRRNASAQVEQRMKLHCSFATTKRGPGKQAQAQIDGRRVECVDSFVQFHAQRLVSIQVACSPNEYVREIGVNPPIVGAVRIGQRAARDLAAQSGVIQFRPKGAQTCLDVAEAFAKCQLRERQTEELIATRKTSRPTIAAVTSHARVELASRQEVHQLREDQLIHKHARPFVREKRRKVDQYGGSS